ncbi:MAG: transglutaminase family protein [Hyphomicrobiales bacterium]|nr:transglutaminase family protein [Hyphomicrobiales bacterium]
MIYDVRHITTYSYDAPVAFARCALRLLPRDDQHQRVLSTRLEMKPLPISRNEREDFFGNRVVDVSLETAHRQLRVEARSRVEVRRDEPSLLRTSPAWEEVSRQAFAAHTLAPSSPAHFIYPSRLAPIMEPITLYARKSFRQGGAIIEAAADLMHRMRADFRYDPKATVISTPLLEAFERRVGVCQDFAHVMISGLRGLGLSAAYVSGYIRSVPAPGQECLEGADASHAWVAVWCGPEEGWIGFDPTNDREVANEHVVLAIGRDYDDISPIHGILLGPGEQEIDVGVDVIPWAGAAA